MFKSILEWYDRQLRSLITILITTMLVVVSMQVFSRFTGFIPRYLWTEEASRFCFVWVIMIGSIIAVRDKTHFNVDILPHPKSKRVEGIYGLLPHSAMLVMAFVFVRYGFEFACFGAMQSSEISQINMLSIYLAFPVAGVSWILFLVEHLLRDVILISSQEQGVDS
ncbi:MAG TPA: TRAP transporter small permease [Pirellula sp.]|nr:TRAP transporter small permease [Pirellula sp.]